MVQTEMTGSFRGPFEADAACLVYFIVSRAEKSNNQQAVIATLLDVVRDEHADVPKFVTMVIENTLARAARLGLLGESTEGTK